MNDEVIQIDYLIGILLRVDSQEKYMPFVSNNLESEKEMLFEFLDFVKTLNDYVIYHYHSYDSSHLNKMMIKYEVDDETRSTMLDHMIDVYNIATDSVVFPTYGNGLKKVAASLGFVWRHQDVGATESIALYYEYIVNPNQNKDNLKLILDYNEDDCCAVRVIKDWLESVRTSETGDPQVEWPT